MHASKFTKFKLIVLDARVFPGISFDFIYPHNSSLFFATHQIYVAADKNKIYSPVLQRNKFIRVASGQCSAKQMLSSSTHKETRL